MAIDNTTANEELTENDINNNEDMLATSKHIEQTISFKVKESAAPERSWTKKQIRSVWIIGAVVTVLAVVFSLLFGSFDIFGFFQY